MPFLMGGRRSSDWQKVIPNWHKRHTHTTCRTNLKMTSSLQLFMVDLLKSHQQEASTIQIVVDNARIPTIQNNTEKIHTALNETSDHSCRRWYVDFPSRIVGRAASANGSLLVDKDSKKATSLRRRSGVFLRSSVSSADMPARPTRKASGEVKRGYDLDEEHDLEETETSSGYLQTFGAAVPSLADGQTLLGRKHLTTSRPSSSRASWLPLLSPKKKHPADSTATSPIKTKLPKKKRSSNKKNILKPPFLRSPLSESPSPSPSPGSFAQRGNIKNDASSPSKSRMFSLRGIRSLSKTTLGILDTKEQAPTIPIRRRSTNPDYLSPPPLSKPPVLAVEKKSSQYRRFYNKTSSSSFSSSFSFSSSSSKESTIDSTPSSNSSTDSMGSFSSIHGRDRVQDQGDIVPVGPPFYGTPSLNRSLQ